MMPKKKNTLLRVIDCYFETTDSRRLTSYTMLVIINTTDWGPPRAKPIHTLLQQRFTMTLFEWGQGSEAACPRSQISQGQQQHTNLVLTPKPLCKTTSHTAVPCPLEDLTSSPKYSLANGEAEDQRGKDLPKASSKGRAWIPGLLLLTVVWSFPLCPLVCMENKAWRRSPKGAPTGNSISPRIPS